MHTDGRALVVARHGRTVVIQPLTDVERFRALRALGVKEVLATAMLANLITVKVKAG